MRLASIATLGVTLLCSVLSAQLVYPTGTTLYNSALTFDGNTLFQEPAGTVVLVDMNGNLVHQWFPATGLILRNPEPLPNGNILALMVPFGGPDKLIVEMDWGGNVVWSYTAPAWVSEIHHDYERLANGNTLLLCSRNITVPYISPLPITDDCLLEISPTGQTVWTWFTYQHFYGLGLDAQARALISEVAGDWAHANSAQTIPANTHTNPIFAEGNIVVSQRRTNIIFIIEKATKAIVWRSGPNDNITQGQHNPYMIPMGLPGAGNILVFDNGSGTGYPPNMETNNGTSKVKEIDPNTKTTVWEYSANSPGTAWAPRDFYSDVVSNAARLANGNTFIVSGVQGRFFEVTTTGEVVWEYMSPYFGPDPAATRRLVYRAHRVATDWGQ